MSIARSSHLELAVVQLFVKLHVAPYKRKHAYKVDYERCLLGFIRLMS